jgi:hypothetical protein
MSTFTAVPPVRPASQGSGPRARRPEQGLGAPLPHAPAGGPRRAGLRVVGNWTLGEQRRPAGPGRQPVRLTRRGRVVLVCFFVLVTLATSALALRDTSAATNRSGELRYRTVVVSPGQTLWGIARESAPGVDPRITVARIMKFNALSSAVVQPGQEIAIPR